MGDPIAQTRLKRLSTSGFEAAWTYGGHLDAVCNRRREGWLRGQPPPRTGTDMDASWDAAIKITAVVVAALTYFGSKRREIRIRRAELVRAYTNDFYADDEFLALFMDIDYNRLGTEPIVGSDRELAVIRLLDFLNAMGHNWRRGVLRRPRRLGSPDGLSLLPGRDAVV